MYSKQFLSLKETRAIADAILSEADKDPDFPVAIAIVDSQGDLVYFSRQDKTYVNAARLAIKKAYTAARARKNTHEIHDYYKKINAYWFTSMSDMGDPDFVAIPGGVCIKDQNSNIVGGIGVSGRSHARPQPSDVALAEIGLKAWAKLIGT